MTPRRPSLPALACTLWLLTSPQAVAMQAAPDTAQSHLASGIRLASHGQYKAAKLEFEKANSLEPNSFAVQFNLGQVDLALGDNPHAEIALTHALQLTPLSVETLLLLAQAEANQARPLDALDLLVRARKLAPENPDVLFHMATISMSQGYFEDAIPLLQKAQTISPSRWDIQVALGEADFNSARVDAAIDVFQALPAAQHSATVEAYLGLAHIHLGRLDQAHRDFQSCLKRDPHNRFCLFQTGRIDRLQGDTLTAEAIYKRVLQSDPAYPAALLELATLRIDQKRYAEAIDLLHRYTRNHNDPTAFYKLAIAERSLHQTEAAQHDLAEFQRLSRDAAPTSHPGDHLFDDLDTRSTLSSATRLTQDIASLLQQVQLHPDQPQLVYALTEAYLKAANLPDARKTVADFNARRPDDARTLTGLGVLLARYSLYDDAIAQFKSALATAPNSDDASFDLADAYLHKGNFPDALLAAQHVSANAQREEAYLSLLADIDAHLGNLDHAKTLYRSALERNPDNDQDYLSLALLQMREGSLPEAEHTLNTGRGRLPGSGKILWGIGLLAILQGNDTIAATHLQQAVDLLPEWPGSYATLGFFYFQTGQVDKAREVLDRFRNSSAQHSLDVARIQQVLEQAPSSPPGTSLQPAQRAQIFQLALYLVDKTL